MKERPILFGVPMVRAILDGGKTQTRRVAKPQPSDSAHTTGADGTPMQSWWETGGSINRCPYGRAGDRLWVREPWKTNSTFNTAPPRDLAPGVKVFYLADPGYSPDAARYRHARFMPRWASRITLEVTDVRVERLQSISYADIVAEGVTVPVCADSGNALIEICTKDGAGAFLTREQYKDPEAIVRAHWAALWCQINGRASWDANPWVWALTFQRVIGEGARA